MRKILREIHLRFPHAEVTTTGSNHYKVKVPNGDVVIVSGTPRSSNNITLAVIDARRKARKRHRQHSQPQGDV